LIIRSLSAAVGIGIIILLRLLFLKTLPRRTFWLLWCVVCIALLIPVNVRIAITLPSLTNNLDVSSFIPLNFESAHFQSAADHINGIVFQRRMPKLVVLIWITVAISTFLYFIVKHYLCLKIYKTASPLESLCVDIWK